MKRMPARRRLKGSAIAFKRVSKKCDPCMMSSRDVIAVSVHLIPPVGARRTRGVIQGTVRVKRGTIPNMGNSCGVANSEPPIRARVRSNLVGTLSRSIGGIAKGSPIMSTFANCASATIITNLLKGLGYVSCKPKGLTRTRGPSRCIRVTSVRQYIRICHRLVYLCRSVV